MNKIGSTDNYFTMQADEYLQIIKSIDHDVIEACETAISGNRPSVKLRRKRAG